MIIEIVADLAAGGGATGDQGIIDFDVEVKEVGGSYANIYNYGLDASGNSALTDKAFRRIVHTLTTGQKANGVQVKFLTSGHNNNPNGGYGNITNKNTMLRVI